MNSNTNFFVENLPLFWHSIGETLYISLTALVVSGILGLLIGVLLYGTRKGGILANRPAYFLINLVVNIVRPVPFIIFLTAIGPLTLLTLHSTIGDTVVVFAISLSAAFAVSRIVEQNLLTVDPGVVEAARAAGANPWAILITVVLPEGLGPLVLGYTFVFIGIVDMSAQASIVGGGGLGAFAIVYGYQQYNWLIVYVAVAAIIVIVQAGQLLGNYLARRALRR